MARQKTEHLPGLEPKRIAAITKQAEKYADFRDKRMDLLKKEVEEKGKLLDLMKLNKLTTYKDEDLLVELLAKENVKVKIKGEDAHEEE